VCARQEINLPITSGHRVADVLAPTNLEHVQLGGYLGRTIDLCVRNHGSSRRIGIQLVAPFRQRGNRLLANRFWVSGFCRPPPRASTRAAPSSECISAIPWQSLIATQTADGYIGNYADGSHLKSWDIWGRKYTLLGLLAWFDMTGDAAALASARRLADT